MKNERLLKVFIVSIIMIVVAGVILPKPDIKKLQYRRFWANKANRNEKHDIIILGDSRTYRGVSPSTMNEVLPGMSIFNFGFSSGRLNKYMYRQVEKRLDLNSQYKAIILAITPNSLTEISSENDHINSQLLLPKEEIYQLLHFTTYLHFFSPVNVNSFEKRKRKDNYVEIYHDDGWVESYKIIEDTTEAFDEYENWFKQVNISEKYTNNLIEQTNQWTKQGIHVFAFRVPTSVAMEKLEDSLAGFNEDEIVKRFENAGGIWIETQSSDYHSYDGSHLHKDSAVKLSRYLAEMIKKYKK